MRHTRKNTDVSAEDIAQLQGELEQLLGERWDISRAEWFANWVIFEAVPPAPEVSGEHQPACFPRARAFQLTPKLEVYTQAMAIGHWCHERGVRWFEVWTLPSSSMSCLRNRSVTHRIVFMTNGMPDFEASKRLVDIEPACLIDGQRAPQ